MSGRFKDVPLLPPDAIIDLNRQIKVRIERAPSTSQTPSHSLPSIFHPSPPPSPTNQADNNLHKVDLGIGAYRDGNGKPYILNVVTAAEARVIADPTYK